MTKITEIVKYISKQIFGHVNTEHHLKNAKNQHFCRPVQIILCSPSQNPHHSDISSGMKSSYLFHCLSTEINQ